MILSRCQRIAPHPATKMELAKNVYISTSGNLSRCKIIDIAVNEPRNAVGTTNCSNVP